MDRRKELGQFLRSRRARLQPADAGLPTYGGRRRVPGLRREELAQLAGVSVDYYVRLEQGRTENVSDAVLDAVARALRLDNAERTHLRNLANPIRSRRRRPRRPHTVRSHLRQLLDAMDAVPAYIVGPRTEVLAWNSLAAALIVDFAALAPEDRSLIRLIFLDDSMRSLFVDWTAKACESVAFLRLNAGKYPDDPELAVLVRELSMKSDEFRQLWADYAVHDKSHGVKQLRHPLVGDLTLAYETLRIPTEPDQALVVFSAEAGSASEASLRLLGSWSRQLPEQATREARLPGESLPIVGTPRDR